VDGEEPEADESDKRMNATVKTVTISATEYAALKELAMAAFFVNTRLTSWPKISQGDTDARRLCEARLDRAVAATTEFRRKSPLPLEVAF